jgi:hypothetical protein
MTITHTGTSFRFDDRAITWRPFRGPVGLSFWVLHVNEAKQHVDILFRLEPFARCVPHNHVGPTSTLVIDGEHRTYQKADGDWAIDEVRPPGTFAVHEGGSIHVEEGGPNGAIILLSMTAVNGVIWTLLDDNHLDDNHLDDNHLDDNHLKDKPDKNNEVLEETTVNDFVRALAKQNS